MNSLSWDAAPRPEWIAVRCGDQLGQLHVPSGNVRSTSAGAATPGQARDERGAAMVSLAGFERLGGRARCKKWKSSVLAVSPGGEAVPLGRWLASGWAPCPESAAPASVPPQSEGFISMTSEVRCVVLGHMAWLETEVIGHFLGAARVPLST